MGIDRNLGNVRESVPTRSKWGIIHATVAGEEAMGGMGKEIVNSCSYE
jgi:hypothetical protein